MRNNLFYLILMMVLLVSCEEYYTPDLDETTGLLVVESHLTNDVNQNVVKLSLTKNFYSKEAAGTIAGARVDLVEVGGKTTSGVETNPGSFTLAKIPVVGKSYILRINYNGDLYESDAVIMPPIPSIDTLYTGHKFEKKYRTDAYGVPELIEIPSREIYVDAPMTSALKYYRFSWRAVLQWIYVAPMGAFNLPPPIWYGWNSKYDLGSFNLAGPKEFSVSTQINKHPILSLAYNGQEYLDSTSQSPAGWIILIDQYGIQKPSYDFHDKLNKQFAAEGSLFDPVQMQVYGNIHCKNKPEKIALGFFDLNSYRQYRYFFDFGTNTGNYVRQRRLPNSPEIPGGGYIIDKYPDFWAQY